MALFFFLLGCFQCFALFMLAKIGNGLEKRALREWEQARYSPPDGWPSLALIVPVAGKHPVMETALRSLLAQNYPDFRIYFVTATNAEPAAALVASLARQYAGVEHVVAGQTEGRGQKNHNLLAGIEAAGDSADVYAFCDSTHVARDDFLRCLVNPIARGEAAFTTGYHQVEPADQKIITLAYALSVLFMRFMQGSPALTQPWGGAMAMSRRAFERYHVAALWHSNVVDDCSLGALLAREGARIRLCPGAILRTFAGQHSFFVWQAWLARQILFLKFCMFGEWLSLGLVCLLMVIPPLWAGWACLLGILGIGGGTAPFLALCWFCAIGWTVGAWRRFLLRSPSLIRWIWAFFCASFMFAFTYAATAGARFLVWNNIKYKVGAGGKVESLRRR